MMTVTAVLALLGVTSVAAMYGGTDVVDLTPTNFQREVMKSDNVWIVEFYAPWQGYKNLISNSGSISQSTVQVRTLPEADPRVQEGRVRAEGCG